MKLAMLIAGRIFNFKDNYANIMEKIVQGHEVDFFFSHSPELLEDVEACKALYKPITFNDEPFQTKQINPKFRDEREVNFKKMIFNRQRVFHDFKDYVTRTQTSYDIVINYRMDCYSQDKINYDLVTELHLPTIYIPEGHNHSRIGTCDQLAFGNMDVMEKYMSIYDNIDRYLGVNGCRLHGEETVYSCLFVNKIKPVRFPHNFIIARP